MFFIAKMYKVFYVRPATWVATVPAKDCYHPSTGEGYCNFFFSFCKLLPHGQCFDSSFCQAAPNAVSFGVFNKNQTIFESKNNNPCSYCKPFSSYDQPLQLSNHSYVSVDEDGDGFTITYWNGTNTTDCPDGLFSTLVFTCNRDAVWSFDPNINLGNITQFITAEPTFKDCEVCHQFNTINN